MCIHGFAARDYSIVKNKFFLCN